MAKLAAAVIEVRHVCLAAIVGKIPFAVIDRLLVDGEPRASMMSAAEGCAVETERIGSDANVRSAQSATHQPGGLWRCGQWRSPGLFFKIAKPGYAVRLA